MSGGVRVDPRVLLWRTVKHRFMVGNIGRTTWACGDGYWMAHQSVVGPPPDKREPRPMKAPNIREAVRRHTVGATRPYGGLGHEAVSNGLVVVGQARHDGRGVDTFSPVRAAFDAQRFDALRRCVTLAAGNATGYEMRLDPWLEAVSWWHPRGYPVAVLLGVRANTDRGWPE